MAMVDFDPTDRLGLYARWSYLDDDDWIITGFFQRRQEASVGLSYELFDGVEARLEYRHDWSNIEAHLNSVSAHVTFTF